MTTIERIKRWEELNPERAERSRRERHERLRREAIDAYGGRCECCGESDIHFLTIDHVAGVVPLNHRHANGRRLSGTAFLYRIRSEGFPDTCRLLCWNCNCAYAYYGFCPHQPHDDSQRRYSAIHPVRRKHARC